MSTMQWNEIVKGVSQVCQEVQSYQDILENSIGTGFKKDVRYLMLGAMRDDFARSIWIMAGSLVITKDDSRIADFRLGKNINFD